MTTNDYDIFLKYKQEIKNRAKWLIKLFDANNLSKSTIHNINYLNDSIEIVTVGPWFDVEYASSNDYCYINIPINLFFGSKDRQRKYVKYLVDKKNLGLIKRNQIKFNDIPD